jgi:cyclophilin family peptidyl-prolyl cis-trans isomerase
VRPSLVAALFLALVAGGCGGHSAAKTTEATSATPTETTSATRTSATPVALVTTSLGTFAIRLDVRDSPHLVASFERLARRGFFDGTIFHRIVPGFVIQGGDPTGTGTGGPGYTTTDPPPPGTRYTHGTVAMAKTASDPKGTAGSQFFVVTAADAHLSPDYALLGKVTSGLAVVDRIGTFGDPQTEQRTKRIVVRRIRVRATR